MAHIYKITNLVNGKFYIGSSKDVKKRWWVHKNTLRNKKHRSPILQNAWNKYGEENFEFTILEEVGDDEQLKVEQYYLDKYKPYEENVGYNIARYTDWKKMSIQPTYLCETCTSPRRKLLRMMKPKLRSMHYRGKLDCHFCDEECGRYLDEDFYTNIDWDWARSEYEYKKIDHWCNDWTVDDHLAYEYDERMSK